MLDVAESGEAALAQTAGGDYDVIVPDMMLPDLDGGADDHLVKPFDFRRLPRAAHAPGGHVRVPQALTNCLENATKFAGHGGEVCVTAWNRDAEVDVIQESILDTVGATPLVRLSRIGAGLTPRMVATSYLRRSGPFGGEVHRGRSIVMPVQQR